MRILSPRYVPRSTSLTLRFPAPTGVNLVDPPNQLGPGECVELENLIPGRYGARTRPGAALHHSGGSGIRTLFGFEGSTSAQDRMFACIGTDSGAYIINVTSANLSTDAVPQDTGDVSWGETDGVVEGAIPGVSMAVTLARDTMVNLGAGTNVGYGVACAFTAPNGSHYLHYTDEAVGLYIYREGTGSADGTWTKPTSDSTAGNFYGTDPSTFVFVTTWKKRLWFVKRDSTLAYYLDANAYAGTCSTFDFGPQFKHGGHLVGLWSWTLDAGEGMDDMLVAISSSGDVVIYQGTDPDYFPEIRLKGVWYLGQVPAGRRIATDHGGDLLILSSLGLVPLSKLVNGASLSTPGLYVTHKISPAIQKTLQEYSSYMGWALAIHPAESLLFLIPPGQVLFSHGWAMSLATGGWCHLGWERVDTSGASISSPPICATPWKGRFFFGTGSGVIYANEGGGDQRLAPSVWRDPITCIVIPGFTDAGTAKEKRVLMVRPLTSTIASITHMEPAQGGLGFVAGSVRVLTDLDAWTGFLYSRPPYAPEKGYRKGWVGGGATGVFISVLYAFETTLDGTLALNGIDVLYDTGNVL